MKPTESMLGPPALAEPEPYSIDVVIVTFNSAKHIEPAIRSVLAQQQVDTRFLIQDNGSTDDTAQVVQRLSKELEIDLAFASDPSNPGFAKAVNSLLAQCQSKLVLILNPDTAASSEADKQTLRALCELALRPEVGVVSPRLETMSGEMDKACMRREPTLFRSAATITAGAFDLEWLRRWGYNTPDPGPKQIEVDAVNGAFMLVERAKVDQVGLLDERYWMYAEDIDWCRSFRENGYRNICAAQWTWQHVKSGSEDGKRGTRTSVAFAKAMSLYFDKHHPGARFLPARALVRLLTSAMTRAPKESQ